MQTEIKIVLFQPTTITYAADIYINGERKHCGKGHVDPTLAYKEATDWLTTQVNPYYLMAIAS